MEPTEKSFLKDVSEHQMHVLMDNGVYRHIRFKRPGTGCFHFDLITYPGYLVYSGDMGCYVFARTEDMFEFFRMNKNDWNYNREGGLSINLGYWSEKLQAVAGGRHKGSATEMDDDRVKAVINEYRVRWMRDYRDSLTKDQRRELWDAVENDVLYQDGGDEMLRAAYQFSERIGKRCFQFDDLFEHNFERFTYHFIWCCYALAWGVAMYDSTSEKIAIAA
jgi:hypothetical protein